MELCKSIQRIQTMVEKPARYSGGEPGMAIKDPQGKVRLCLAFPDTYEIGMSHLGLRLLYHIANGMEDAYAERCFAPWTDMEAQMRENALPLFSLETKTPLAQFDIIGFTLQYEMCYSNLLNMLDLAGIPLRSADRGTESPLIVCGGPCACNPAPLSPFADVFVIGDGEDAIVELCREVGAWKKAGGKDREELLRALSLLEGFYIPALGNKTRRRVIKNLDEAPFPDKLIVPYLEIVHDRANLEVFRGCTRGCRFCQAGFLYRPVREREKGTLLRQAGELIKNTGYDEISLSSLSTGDYSCLGELITELMEQMADQRVSVSLPSLRIDSFAKEQAEQIQRVRKSGLTFAPEAGTQRLRDVINKGVTEQDLLNSVGDAFSSGWNSIKLYFMIGLPTETDEDLDGIVDLAQKVVGEYFKVAKVQRAPGLRVGVSASCFVPKPFTPFQWVAQDTMEVLERKQKYLRAKFKGIRGVDFSYHSPDRSFLEAAFARGDEKLADVLEEAFRNGCKFDGWSDQFRFGTYMAAFQTCGVDPAEYANRELDPAVPLPYEKIDMLVRREYLVEEYNKALCGGITKDCRGGCNNCFGGEARAHYCSI